LYLLRAGSSCAWPGEEAAPVADLFCVPESDGTLFTFSLAGTPSPLIF
jgi:hypothetical protein